MSIETWEIFLKLLISITDSILRQDVANENIKGLQKKLCPQLLKVLFELWLLSRTRNPSLWFALKQRVRGWTHHISLILTWRETCFALTRRSTSILYGPAGLCHLQSLPFPFKNSIFSFWAVAFYFSFWNCTIHFFLIFFKFSRMFFIN